MDRNWERATAATWARVALRKESVDRNAYHREAVGFPQRSLSARRAWIEMQLNHGPFCFHRAVALRKESVDRNTEAAHALFYTTGSLSARRAWIEMKYPPTTRKARTSLSARRAWIEMSRQAVPHLPMASLSARRAWIEITGVLWATMLQPVALRKESVDRNKSVGRFRCTLNMSLSARRAWIEIDIPSQRVAELSGRSPQGERG